MSTTRTAAVTEAAGRLVDRAAATAFAPYQTATLRIGLSGLWLFYLVRHWPDRLGMHGPDAPLSWEMAQSWAGPGAFDALLWWPGRAYYEFFYLLAIAAAAAVLVGWRTRTASVVMALGILSFQHRNEFVTNAGDRLLHILALYLIFTRCAQVWSLDARRVRRGNGRDVTGIVLWALSGTAVVLLGATGRLIVPWVVTLGVLWLALGLWWAVSTYAPEVPRSVCDRIANLVHNGALVVIAFQICIVYACAGWYKIPGSTWREGSAVYYALHQEFLTSWPMLSEALTSSSTLVLAMTYGTVIVQVAFPFALLRRKAKNVLLVLLIGEHIGIGVLMGLPYFSMVMIAADAVFAPTVLLVWLGRTSGRIGRRLLDGKADGEVDGTADGGGGAPGPAPASASGSASVPAPAVAGPGS
ncbi:MULTISPECIES: HTTM domain-containing protein [Streptomyces]|uniref:HTTM domain-containing protein n=1 Tax=Streptomyces solicathayae TaxID=3081768 RepID=A0ABZ0LNM0_9ACTN|nr:HTTM domain-containing protein [Streptomyces sp. HUAS YS2]WOX21069.1 HTTM domain-containing protein [Streptomyces sp. HUAS YS2]